MSDRLRIQKTTYVEGTGEVHSITDVRKQHYLPRGWRVCYMKSIKELTRHVFETNRVSTLIVFFEICETIQFNTNVFESRISYLSKEVKFTPKTVYKAIDDLLTIDAIRQCGDNKGHVKTFIVNPELSYFGTASNYDSVKRNYDSLPSSKKLPA